MAADIRSDVTPCDPTEVTWASGIDAELAPVDAELARIDAKVDAILARIDAEIEAELAPTDAEFAPVDAELERRDVDLGLGWMSSTMLPVCDSGVNKSTASAWGSPVGCGK